MTTANAAPPVAAGAIARGEGTGRFWRIAGAASGLATIATEVAALALVSAALPKPGTTTQVLSDFVRNNQAGLRTYSLLAGLVSGFLLWYAVSLGRYLRRGDDGAELGTVAMAAGSAQAILHWVAASTLLMLPISVSAWTDLDLRVPVGWIGAYLTFLAYPTVVFAGAAGLRIVQTGLLPRWLGWAGLFVAAAELFTVFGSALAANGPLSSGGTVGFASFLLWMAWIVATSIGLTRQELKR